MFGCTHSRRKYGQQYLDSYKLSAEKLPVEFIIDEMGANSMGKILKPQIGRTSSA